MELSIDFGRWTTTKAALAVAGALAIAGAIESAVAFSPIIAPPIKWQGGAEAKFFPNPSGLQAIAPEQIALIRTMAKAELHARIMRSPYQTILVFSATISRLYAAG